MPDASFVWPMFWQSALVPFAVALAVLASGRALRVGNAAPVVALTAGWLGAFAAAQWGQWSPVPRSALDWLPWIVAGSALAVVAIERLPVARRQAARLVAGGVVAGIVVWPAFGSFGLEKSLGAVLMAGALMALAWSVLARGGNAGAMQPLLLALVTGGGGLALMLDSSQSVGRLAGALACALLACSVFARGHAPVGPAACGLAVLVFGALLANAHLYAGFPLGYVALLVAAMLAAPLLVAAMLAAPLLSVLTRQRRWLAGALATLVPVAVTVALAVKSMQDSGGY
jgi:hypothetical protein